MSFNSIPSIKIISSSQNNLAGKKVGRFLVRPSTDVETYSLCEEKKHTFDTNNKSPHTISFFNRLGSNSKRLRQMFTSVTTISNDDAKNIEYESHDYDAMENDLYVEHQQNQTRREKLIENCSEWFLLFCIGVAVALVATLVELGIEYSTSYKYKLISEELNSCSGRFCHIRVLSIWIGINVMAVLFASIIVTCWMPQASGSGIPNIKAYLNGVHIPGLLRIQTLFCRTFGIVFSILGGLACGKEGPMIHTGGIIAGGISQCRSTFFKIDWKIFKSLQTDARKRDFVACGTSAGVSAAFGAPIGGVMFSLEEGTSFCNPALTIRLLFSSITATFTVNLFMSAFYNHLDNLSSPGLISFGTFERNHKFHIIEFPIFVLMGCIGGITGAGMNLVNAKINKVRLRIKNKLFKIMECVLVSIISAIIPYILLTTMKHCVSDDDSAFSHDHDYYKSTSTCPTGQHNSISGILFSTPELSLSKMLHASNTYLTSIQLAILAITYISLTTITYGISVSCGIFVPCLLTGACWGRLIGNGLSLAIPWLNVDVGRYALIGAAAQIGGNLRMTISLSVILFECTGDIMFVLPVVIVLIGAKFVGQCFTRGMYDEHIALMKIPFLPWNLPNFLYKYTAADIMHTPVIVFTQTESLSYIKNVFKVHKHSAFPIVTNRTHDLTQTQILPKAASLPKKKLKRRQTSAALDKNVLSENVESLKYLVDFDKNQNKSLNESQNFKYKGYKKYGALRGLILKSQIELLIEKKNYRRFSQTNCTNLQNIQLSDFDRWKYSTKYHKSQNISSAQEANENLVIELGTFSNYSPFTVPLSTPVPRLFRLFRLLGLRHLIVTKENQICGIITRKDLAQHIMKPL